MITAANRAWVEGSYAWFTECFNGERAGKWITFDKEYFPNVLSSQRAMVGPLLDDLCSLLSLERQTISIQFLDDTPDIPQAPFQMSGLPEGSSLNIQHISDESRLFEIQISNRLRPYRELVLRESILRLMDVVANLERVDIPDTGEGRTQWLELAAIYQGFGPILARNRNARVSESNMTWRTTFTHASALPNTVFAYALLHHVTVNKLDQPRCERDLPSEVLYDFSQTLRTTSAPAGSDHAIQPVDRMGSYLQAYQDLWFTGKHGQAIELSIGMLDAVLDSNDLAMVHNNTGYALSYIGQHPKSIPYLRRAIELDPDHAYPLDNLGFALLMTGELEAGLASTLAAMKAQKKHLAGYSHRNLAIYHWLNGDRISAEKDFLGAFDETEPVDLLNALYAQFLRHGGEYEEATIYDTLSEDELGGPAPAWVNSIGNPPREP